MFLFAEAGGHHYPLISQFINHYFGEPVYHFQLQYTKPLWEKVLKPLGTTPEALFGPYTPDNAIPWWTIMFVIACILSIVFIKLFMGKLQEDDITPGQFTLEAGFLYIRDLVTQVIGEHGLKYFPVVMTFAVLILTSNLMGQFPMFMPPTGSVNVTYALALTSFIYYNYVGIHENGLAKHLGHFAGPKLPLIMAIFLTPLIFSIELVSNMIRPFTLGVRLFANMFADEKLAEQVAGLYPPYTQILIPVTLLPLAFFVAFVQTLVFTLLSMIYISEVSHAPHELGHDEYHHNGEAEAEYALT
jgi:F-type H+-transporting ATPase subunit a